VEAKARVALKLASVCQEACRRRQLQAPPAAERQRIAVQQWSARDASRRTLKVRIAEGQAGGRVPQCVYYLLF
jgi:hypothetical protein